MCLCVCVCVRACLLPACAFGGKLAFKNAHNEVATAWIQRGREKVPWHRNTSQCVQLMNKRKVCGLLLREGEGYYLFVCLFVCSFMFVLNDMPFVQGWISWWEGREGVWRALIEKGGERNCGTSERVP